MKGVWVILLLCICHQVQAQNILKGKVLDSLTHQPIQYVNVFFANTSIGSVTNNEGEFLIQNFPSGKYDLTISFVGYTTVQEAVEFLNVEKNMIVYLMQQATQLQEVFVRADTAGWADNFREFKRYFLGSTQNANNTVINNPREVRLYYDRHDRLMVGFSKTPIEIQNRSLGYLIYYQLMEFQINYADDRIAFFGIPRFENMIPKGKREEKQWEKERLRAYRGSFNHFIRSVKENALVSNGFIVHPLFRIKNPSRPDDPYLNERIKFWREKNLKEKGVVVIGSTDKTDSLSYYIRLKSLPALLDSLGQQITDSNTLISKNEPDVIQYNGMLKVVYTREKEEVSYRMGNTLNEQRSVIHFLGNKLRIYENGYYEDVKDVFFEGYMGWGEKLAELLPLEYEIKQ